MVDLSGLTNLVDFSIVSAAAGIIIGMFRGLLELRSINKTRQAELFMRLYNNWNSIEFSKQRHEMWRMEWNDYDDFRKKYNLRNNPEAWAAYNSAGRFYEGLGVLVHRKLIDISWMYDTMAEDVIYFWDKFKEYTKTTREDRVPEAWLFVEYLYNIILKNKAEIQGVFPHRHVAVTTTSQRLNLPKHPI